MSVSTPDQEDAENIQEYIRKMATTEWCPLLLRGKGGAVGSGFGSGETDQHRCCLSSNHACPI